jgi:hypothetical protein
MGDDRSKAAYFNYQFFVGNFPCRYTSKSCTEILQKLVDSSKALHSDSTKIWQTLFPTLHNEANQLHMSLDGKEEGYAILSETRTRSTFLKILKFVIFGFLRLIMDSKKKTFDRSIEKELKGQEMADLYNHDWFSSTINLMLESMKDMGLGCMHRELLKAILLDTEGRDDCLNQLKRQPAIVVMKLLRLYFETKDKDFCTRDSGGNCFCFMEEDSYVIPSAPISEPSRSSYSSSSSSSNGVVPRKRIMIKPDWDNIGNFRCLCAPMGNSTEPPKAKTIIIRNNPKLVGKSMVVCERGQCRLKEMVVNITSPTGTWKRPPYCKHNMAMVKLKIDHPGSPNHNKWKFVCPHHGDPDTNCGLSEDVYTNKKRKM